MFLNPLHQSKTDTEISPQDFSKIKVLEFSNGKMLLRK